MKSENATITCILCDNPVRLRGLCQAHYQKYRRQRDRALEDGLSGDEFDEISIKEGYLLPDSRYDSSRPGNPFMAVYEKLKSGYVVAEGKAVETSSDKRRKSKSQIKDKIEKELRDVRLSDPKSNENAASKKTRKKAE